MSGYFRPWGITSVLATSWWRTQSYETGLRSGNSLLTGKRTGRNEICGRFRSNVVQISWIDQQLTEAIPYAAEQGINSSLQRKNCAEGVRTGKATDHRVCRTRARNRGVPKAQVERGCHGALGAMIVAKRRADRRRSRAAAFSHPTMGRRDAIRREPQIR